MAIPIINDLILPRNIILVLPDEGQDPERVGVVVQRSIMGGGYFKGSADPVLESSHVIFAREMAAPVIIDGVKHYTMHENAVVGLIPD